MYLRWGSRVTHVGELAFRAAVAVDDHALRQVVAVLFELNGTVIGSSGKSRKSTHLHDAAVDDGDQRVGLLVATRLLELEVANELECY